MRLFVCLFLMFNQHIAPYELFKIHIEVPAPESHQPKIMQEW